MGVHLVQVAEEFVKSLLVRYPRGTIVAQSPFAETAGDVASLLQHFRDGHVFRQQR